MTVTDSMYQTQHLPEAVTHVKKDTIKSFAHSKRVGGFLLGRTLGVGSFAKVKEGLHLTTGEKVAVKVIDKKRAKTDNYVRKNLRREGRLLQMVRHPNVVALFEVMETDNSYYLVTELCRGGDLMEYITAKKRLPESEVNKFIRQIVSAVDYLHGLGIIHRDLKIENLLLDGNKNIKLIDFGLSNSIKVASTPEGVRAQEFCVTQCGSPAYAAPELLNHEKYGLQVDLWSIGVNMYAMLTGGLPFTVEPFNIKALYGKMRDRLMNPVPDDLSRECRDLLRKFLNPDPLRRVTIMEAIKHPWLTQGNKPIVRHPCPNKMRTSDLEADILAHMSDNLGFRMGEVIKFVTCNTPSPACSTYHLYLQRLTRHQAELRSTGQVAAPLAGRSAREDGKITLHLQDMRNKARLEDTHRQNSTPNPAGRLLSRESAGTDATDNTTAASTSNSKKDSGIGTCRSTAASKKDSEAQVLATDNSSDRKENKIPSAPPVLDYSDVPALKGRNQGSAKFTPRHVTKRMLQEPLTKIDTENAMSLTLNSPRESKPEPEAGAEKMMEKRESFDNVQSPRLALGRSEMGHFPRQHLKPVRADSLDYPRSATISSHSPDQSTLLTTRVISRPAMCAHEETVLPISEHLSPMKVGLLETSTELRPQQHQYQQLQQQHLNNNNNVDNRSRTNSGSPKSVQLHQKLLARREVVAKTLDGSNHVGSHRSNNISDNGNSSNSNNNNNINNARSNFNHSTISSTRDKNNNNRSGSGDTAKNKHNLPATGKPFPVRPSEKELILNHASPNFNPAAMTSVSIRKQFVPFRSSQDRPRMTMDSGALHGVTALRPLEKAKTSESMTLHGKHLHTPNYQTDTTPSMKRAVSPQNRPVGSGVGIVRRRLTKRHRIGELSQSGGNLIQDVDQSTTTELLLADHESPMSSGGGGASGVQTLPLPSISPTHISGKHD